MSTVYYEPTRIFLYTTSEIAWIIREAWYHWPPQTSGYIDTHERVQTGTPTAMPGQSEIEVIAEVKARLGLHKRMGRVLVDEVQGQAFDAVDLSRYEFFQSYLSRDARDYLCYISGPRRKKISFADWLWKRAKGRR